MAHVPDAILNPFAALQSTAEDFLESLGQNAGTAQAELINCVLRACGCNDSVDGDEVLDHDGVLDMLDNITESLKQVRTAHRVAPFLDFDVNATG
jgi:cohesin complex subunit SA-1/2